MDLAHKRKPSLGDDSLMPFGKHKDERMEDVPASYLLWLSNQDWIKDWPLVSNYIWNVQQDIKQEIGESIGIK